MSLPTEAECLDFLKISKNAIADQRGADWYWMINGVDYPERNALKLAEYCLITGQVLTSLATIEGALNLARRVVILEERITDLGLDAEHLIAHDHKHWWRRG